MTRSTARQAQRKDIMKRIKKNNLLPWFTDDHRTLPASYKRSCKKFFKELSAKLDKTKLKDYKGL
jgi:nicotinamide riboside kinase